jgi:predicted RNA-binding protein with PUA-like domain
MHIANVILGVRNHQAKNHMIAMKKGDQAFFYHSNCKPPGIVGIMEIVEEATPDGESTSLCLMCKLQMTFSTESAFDEKDPYYDPKAKRDNPKGWVVVHVEFRQKFDHMITLDHLKTLANEHSDLSTMQIIKPGNRLSVTKVSPQEWSFILKQAEAGVPAIKNGDAPKPKAPKSSKPSTKAKAPATTAANKSKLAPPDEKSNAGSRATSVPPSSKKTAPKKGHSRTGSRARSVPAAAGPSAETGPAGGFKETPITVALAKVAEEHGD